MWLLQFSLWISVAVAKTYLFYMVLIWQKDCVEARCVNACMGMTHFSTHMVPRGRLPSPLHITDTPMQRLVQLVSYTETTKLQKNIQEYFLD